MKQDWNTKYETLPYTYPESYKYSYPLTLNNFYKIEPNDLIFLEKSEELIHQVMCRQIFAKIAIGRNAKNKVKVAFYNFFIWVYNENLSNKI